MLLWLVDDSDIDRFLARRVIAKSLPGALLREFGCPLEALEAATVGDLPDLLLLDLHMPRIDGFEVLERLPTSTRAIRVAVLTSSSAKADRERALGFSFVTAFLEKPLSRGSLDPILHGLRD